MAPATIQPSYATSYLVNAAPSYGLLDILGAFWRGKWLILLLPIVFAAAAAYFAADLDNEYDATAQVLIDPRELRVLANDVNPQGLNSDASASYVETQARIITSNDMLRRIVVQEDLTSDLEYTKPPSAFQKLLGAKAVEGDKTLAVAAALGRNLSVRRGEKTFVVDIQVTSNDPVKSAKLANAFAAAYLADQAKARKDVSGRASTTLTGRLDELQQRVKTAEDKVEAYRRE